MVKIIQFIIRLIYPSRCSFCQDIIEQDNEFNLCKECFKKLKLITNSCKNCGKILSIYNSDICFDCKSRSHSFDKAFSVVQYKDDIKRMLKKYKFYGRLDLEDTLIKMLLVKAKSINDIDVVMGIPIHQNRYKERGFNQSSRLAKGISKRMNWAFCDDALIKVKDTTSQSQLCRSKRLINLINAFKVSDSKKITDKSILLIDDIYTTGSTVSECAKILKENGAKSVYVLTVASGDDF